MSGSSDEGDQRKVESTSRMWAESQPGPSRCQPSRQGYCGYCRVLYSNLDQHLSSLRHLDSVRSSSRGSSTVSSASGSRTKLTLLERFLQDVMQHHPHRYNDPRPSHADLPSVSAPPLPREELDELRFSDEDSRSLGTRENLPSSDDASCQPANRKEDNRTHSQSGEGDRERESKERLSAPIREQEEGGPILAGHTQSSQAHTLTPHSKTPPPHHQATPTVHRKAHRKTNRRKTSDSSLSEPTCLRDTDLDLWAPTELRPSPGPGPGPRPSPRPSKEMRYCPDPSPCPGPSHQPPTEHRPLPEPGPCPRPRPMPPTELKPCPDPGTFPRPSPRPPTELRPCPDPSPCSRPSLRPEFRPCSGPGPWPLTESRPWLRWEKERREAHKEEAFSSDHSDSVDQTIEEVIQMCCYGVSSATPWQQDETESFHFSLPVSMETQSDDWDSPVQQRQTLSDTPVQASQVEGRDLSHLMDAQVDLEDQVYLYQLDSALNSEQRAGTESKQDQGFWTVPIEAVLPAPEHIPESFRGKSWRQIEQEDEQKVEKLVRQFRRGRFICYFDTESLARYGRRSQNKKGGSENEKVESDTNALLLMDDDDSSCIRRRKRGKRAFRVASRCQVVKVSHSTQTIRLVVPAVRQTALEAPPTSVSVANQDVAERTPEVQTWRSLPSSYSNIITPLQPRTSLIYLLCSPSGPAPTDTPALGSTPKRCRKKRRPLDQQGVKVKYKQLPVRFYDPSSNRILKNPPRSFVWRKGSSPPPPCVRQLFRSLSPDLNADRLPGEGAVGSSRVKGQRSSDTFLLSGQTNKQDTVRRRGRISQAPPPPPHSGLERGKGGRRDKTHHPPPRRRTRAQATPPQPRREGLRRAGPRTKAPTPTDPPHSPSPRRGRARRGRGCERGRR
ncbi:DBF4-type zinc finger-containing protein 2 [Centropristis striata]|uniref:DBF4-type zinc finger-containing protein 2 n=1 Tax=Centropristis striata TaxID=184440 RepID=UPI0027DFAD7F|nr:DBF4-type zinc finger-containing protein 2 [Centropristis striata]XP_059184184.1 DBF4-type zinc finger-containing protein 2 [Centropristis striata]